MSISVEKTYMKAVKLRYKCKCGKGYMKVKKEQDGSYTVFGNNPIKYLHVCNKCGKELYLKGKFPRVEYME